MSPSRTLLKSVKMIALYLKSMIASTACKMTHASEIKTVILAGNLCRICKLKSGEKILALEEKSAASLEPSV